LVEHNIEVFKQNTQPGEIITVTQGNAMDLSGFADNAYDITLLLGPMYHLYNQEDKRKALGEAIRVTKQGGIIFVAYCISDATLISEFFASQNLDLLDFINKGMIDPVSFATRSEPKDLFELVRKEDVFKLTSDYPVTRLHYVATDGFANHIREPIKNMDDALFEQYIKYHFAICEREDMLGLSHHSLDVLRKDRQTVVEVEYAMNEDEWEAQKEIAHYKTLPILFDGFIDMPTLSDGVIHLVCTSKRPAIPEKKYVPAYDFAICKGSEKVGEINLRIGYGGYGPDESSLYYGGQVGYSVDEQHRGNGYAVRACRLLLPVAKAHGMIVLLITNDVANTPSKRVCEKLGARFIRSVRLPEWTDLYKNGQRYSNIYEWKI
jgi:predicted acetyltransferase